MPDDLVLIVEDEERNRILVREILEFNGYRTVEADNAEEGIRLARELKPALILMDFHLPGMNGIEALGALRADSSTKGIPVIAVTASAMTEDRARIMSAGFDGLETKPIHMDRFAQVVSSAIRQAKETEK